MNSVADMGGMDGFGKVTVETGEPIFHEVWEAHAVAIHLALALGGSWLDDECRFSIESMGNLHYLTTSYYEHWLYFIEDLLTKKGIVTSAEIDAARLINSAKGSAFVTKMSPDAALETFFAAGTHFQPTDQDPRFSEGQKVMARNLNPTTHTRLPRYVRGKTGTVLKHLGSFGFPDTRAHGLGEHVQHAYSVRFESRELWGPQGRAGDAVMLDMFDSYLEPIQ